jgi:hypothetical protein
MDEDSALYCSPVQPSCICICRHGTCGTLSEARAAQLLYVPAGCCAGCSLGTLHMLLGPLCLAHAAPKACSACITYT